MKLKVLMTILSLLAVTNFDVNALKCWRCASDAISSPFCNDPFDPDLVNEKQRQWTFIDCNQNSYGIQQEYGVRSVCKKMKQLIRGKIVVSRYCAFEDINAPADSCMRSRTPSYIKTEFCETCGHDGCNGAESLMKTSVLMLIPLAVLFFFTI